MLSKCFSNIAMIYSIKIGGVNKLVSNVGNKRKYVLYYKNLQPYLSLRKKVIRVHRVLKFKQSDWLKNTLISIQTKEKMQLMVLEKVFKTDE